MPIDLIFSVTGVKYTNGDGYYFRLSQKLHNKLYLNCQVRSCRVRGTVSADYDRDDKIKCKGNHNHPPDFYEAEFCELERRILERSANEVLPLRRIFLEETTGASPRAVTRLNYPSFLRRMQRRRQFTKRKVPRSLTDFSNLMQSPEFSEFSNVNGQQFFISEIGNHSILFISPVMKDLLKTEDQTFSIYQFKKFVCQTLKQVLIVAKITNHVAFPIIYVGMQTKSQKAYHEVFQKIQEEEPLWNPTTLYVGTEAPLCSAISKSFEQCQIISSWFHFAQEMRREMRNLDLISVLHAELPFYNCIQMIQLIPLLPADRMADGLEIVKDKLSTYYTVPGVAQLMEYVSNNWFKSDRAAQISLYDDSSTSNVELKLLNRQLMHSIRGNTRQDAIWSFTRSLVVVERKYSDAYAELMIGGVPPKWTGNCAVKIQEKKMRNCVARYNSNRYQLEKFLDDLTRTTLTNTLDLNDDGDIEFADDNSDEEDDHQIEVDDSNSHSKIEFIDTYDSSDQIKSEFVTHSETLEYDEFIVEEVEEQECSEADNSDSYENYVIPDAVTPSTSADALKSSKVSADTKISSVKPEKNDAPQKRVATTPADTSHKRKVLLVFSSDSSQVQIEEPSSDQSCYNCVICKKLVYSFACQPCGHMCLCANCCSEFVNKKCPICSKTTLWVQRIYLPHPLK